MGFIFEPAMLRDTRGSQLEAINLKHIRNLDGYQVHDDHK